MICGTAKNVASATNKTATIGQLARNAKPTEGARGPDAVSAKRV
jgi:hypothetical protein